VVRVGGRGVATGEARVVGVRVAESEVMMVVVEARAVAGGVEIVVVACLVVVMAMEILEMAIWGMADRKAVKLVARQEGRQEDVATRRE
jgi:hypothetical protein